MHRLNVMVAFEASHELHGLPDGHKCGRTHGHSYKVEVNVASKSLNEQGMVIDSGLIKDAIRTSFDHRHLNTVLEELGYVSDNGNILNPTAENMSRVICVLVDELLDQHGTDTSFVTRIAVHETESTFAEYIPGDDEDEDGEAVEDSQAKT